MRLALISLLMMPLVVGCDGGGDEKPAADAADNGGVIYWTGDWLDRGKDKYRIEGHDPYTSVLRGIQPLPQKTTPSREFLHIYPHLLQKFATLI